jgi:diguanylate cyclase (GGDEF)-like protein
LEQRVLVEATDFSPAKPLVVAVIPAYNEERFIASAEQRDQAGKDRDDAGQARDQAAGRRDYAAELRDQAGENRDDAGQARDQAAGRRDLAAELRDRAAEQRDRLAEQSEAMEGVEITIDGFSQPVRERQNAASDRKRASQDRTEDAGARAQSKLDREVAHADRGVAANERTGAEGDRVAAQSDRSAAAKDRDNAPVDGVTGAYLRGPGFVELTHEIARVQRTKQPLVLVFVDVDGLKEVNDSLGHAAGDRLLLAVADTLREHLRPYDLIIRYGGDEFVCVLTGLNLAAANSRLASVSAVLTQVTDHGSITLGMAQLQKNESWQDLLERADAVLYQKRKRRRSSRTLGDRHDRA